MAKLGPVPVDLELSEDARQLLEVTGAMRRYGKLETQLPQAYQILAETSDSELRRVVEVVFDQLLALLHD